MRKVIQVGWEKRIKIKLVFIFLLAGLAATAQNKYTINGYVKDSASGESIIGATVSVDGKSVTSNQYGFYSITVDQGVYEALASHVSYLTQSFQVSLTKNIEHTIFLVSKSAALNEVVIYSRRRDANVRNAQMGKIDLSINQVKNIPSFM